MTGELALGLAHGAAPSLTETLAQSQQAGFSFSVLPVIHPRLERELLQEIDGIDRNAPLTRSDRLLPSSQWTTVVVPTLSPWIQLDSPVDHVRRTSEAAFAQEVAWAAHLSCPAVVFPPPDALSINYAVALSHAIKLLSFSQIWVRVPLLAPVPPSVPDATPSQCADLAWNAWNALRTRCEYNDRIHIALEMPQDLPDGVLVDRWFAEPVKAVFLPTAIFLTNKAGYPVLSKGHQAVLRRFMQTVQHYVITGRTDRHRSAGAAQLYQQYIRHMWDTQPKVGASEEATRGYEDYLQAPLQPLMDNLESQTYEVFERDPIKYKLYEEATCRALTRRVPDATTASVTVVMVVGAGRGPLVDAVLRASARTGRAVRLYAVEKNPNAVVTLQNRVLDDWGPSVTVISADMRKWQPPELADILVSELLGSFGDNELSPECLDGALRLLKADGVSIPYDSTSYIAPVSTSKLFNDIRQLKDDKQQETPFVVKLRSYFSFDTPKPLFRFVHPNRDLAADGSVDNSRYATVRFTAAADGLVHGVAGYFESRLFEELQLSILPRTHTPEMFSWFPIFFPFTTPLYVRQGARIDISFWRKNNGTKVWYEWCAMSETSTRVQNPGGRSYFIGL